MIQIVWDSVLFGIIQINNLEVILHKQLLNLITIKYNYLTNYIYLLGTKKTNRLSKKFHPNAKHDSGSSFNSVFTSCQ